MLESRAIGSSNLSTSKAREQVGARPPAAVELMPEGVLAAALPRKAYSAVYAFAPLAAGALVPGIEEANVRSPEAVAAAIKSALNDVSPRSRSVTLVLPDTTVRVFVLDFDSLPAKQAEALAVMRFRLRKMVPFDVEKAGVSYQVLTEDKTECRALIAVLPGPVLDEYEAVVRAAGFEPGAVVPSSLAALSALDSEEPALAASFNGVSLTTSITRGEDLLLYRTLELPNDPAQRLAEVQRDIAVAAAYYEDKLAAAAERLYYGGVGGAEEFARWVQLSEPQMKVVELAARPTTGAATALGKMNFAGVIGALAGAA
jgi:type IV pilus assembly protein PilM